MNRINNIIGVFAIALVGVSLFLPTGLSARNWLTRENNSTYTPFDRGIVKPSTVFIPKGTAAGGFTMSYRRYRTGDSSDGNGFALLSSFIEDVQGRFTTVGVAPTLSYFISDNISVGVRFDYERTDLDLGSAKFTISDDIDFDLDNYGYFKQTYKGALTMRNYMPIADSKRFALFMEGRLTAGYAQSMNYKYEDGLKHGTYSDIYRASLNMVPGVCAFITNNVAFEVQIGVMGLYYQKTIQTENQVNRSSMKNSGGNFHVNLFSLSFGTTIYILDKYHRPRK